MDELGQQDASLVLAAFSDVVEEIADNPEDLDGLLRAIARGICNVVGVSRCSVYLEGDSRGLFRGQVGHARDDIDAGVRRLVAGGPADHFTREIVQSKRPVLVANALSDPRPIQSAMRAWGVRAMLGVPMLHRESIVGIAYLDNEDEPHPFTPAQQDLAAAFAALAGSAIRQAQTTAHLRSSLEVSQRQNALLRQSAVVDHRFTNLVLDGASLRDITETVAELTGKPCALYDAGHRRLVAGTPDGCDVDVLPSMLDPSVTRSCTAAVTSALSDTACAIVGPAPADGQRYRLILAPVAVRGETWGVLVVAEFASRFSALDKVVARRGATMIALELNAEARAASAEWDATQRLLSDLVRGSCDPAALERRAQFVGLDLAVPRALVLVAPRDGDRAAFCARELAAALSPGTGETEASVLATPVPEGVLAMIPVASSPSTRSDVEPVRARVASAIAAIAPVAGSCAPALAAISSICRSPEDYAAAYSEVGQLMSLVTSLAPPSEQMIVAVDDLGAGRMLLLGADQQAAQRFAAHALGPLLDPADPKRRDLLLTVGAFLDCARSVRRCAERLSVHENTIRYRLARIEELTGLAVATDGGDQLTAHVAMLVLRLQRRDVQPVTARGAAGGELRLAAAS